MARLGDTRPCRVCGDHAILQMMQLSAATLGWVDGRSLPYDVAPAPVWHCPRCDDRRPLEGELEP